MSGLRGLSGPNRTPNPATTSGGWEVCKLWTCILAATGLFALSTAPTAMGESGGNKNAGDVWTDNVGQPPGPGHEQDPHLACQDINLWGSGLADPSEEYVIDGWPPSGHQEKDYPTSTWSYNQSLGGSQVISVISVKTLIETAIANGDAPVNGQGYHFKLKFVQDPQKHKTFWVNCTAPKSGGGEPPKEEPPKEEPPKEEPPKEGPPKEEPPKGQGPNDGGGTNTPAYASNTPAAGSPPATPAGQAPKGSVKVTHKPVKHNHKLVRAKRHLKPHKRRVSDAKDAAPKFTG
jgi:hypothetical protein